MAFYAIGDVQGCFKSLKALLKKIQFEPTKDQLWFVGDLINRGPKSLQTLRFIKDLGDAAITVLGNHDLNLLAVAHGYRPLKPRDTLSDILDANDRNELLTWLRHQPLLHHDTELGFTMVHAGMPPQWDLNLAAKLAHEVETTLQGKHFCELLQNMYGDQPDIWSENLTGLERQRFITNCFTRIRFCTTQGRLELDNKGTPGTQQKGLKPWFSIKNRKSKNLKIIFGHWSTLNLCDINEANVFPLDTGCVWGNRLTAMRLDDPIHPLIQVEAQE